MIASLMFETSAAMKRKLMAVASHADSVLANDSLGTDLIRASKEVTGFDPNPDVLRVATSIVVERVEGLAATIRATLATVGDNAQLGGPFTAHADTLDGIAQLVRDNKLTALDSRSRETIEGIGAAWKDAAAGARDRSFAELAALFRQDGFSVESGALTETVRDASGVLREDPGHKAAGELVDAWGRLSRAGVQA